MIKNLFRFAKAMSRHLFPREKLWLAPREDCSSSVAAVEEEWVQELENLEDSSGEVIIPKQEDTEDSEGMQKKILGHFPWKKKNGLEFGKCGDGVGVLDLAVVEDYIEKDFGKLPLPSNRAFDVPKTNVIPCLLNGRDSFCSIAGDDAFNLPVMTLEEVTNLGLTAFVKPIEEDDEDLRNIYGPLTIVGVLRNIEVQLGELEPLTFTFVVQDRDMFPRISLGNKFLAEYGALWEFSNEGSRVSLRQRNADYSPEAPLYFEAAYRQRHVADRVMVQLTERGPSYIMADVSDRLQSDDFPQLKCVRFDILGWKTGNIRVLKTHTLAYSDSDVSLGKTFLHDAHAIVDYQEGALYLKFNGHFEKIALGRRNLPVGHEISERELLWQDLQNQGSEGKEPRWRNLPKEAVRLPEPGRQEQPPIRVPSWLRVSPEKKDDRRRRGFPGAKAPAYRPERRIPRGLSKSTEGAAPRHQNRRGPPPELRRHMPLDWSQMSSTSSPSEETPQKQKGHFVQDLVDGKKKL